MSYHFPSDVAELVRQEMAICGYDSEDELLRSALQLHREVKAREVQLLAEIRLGLEQANQGLARPVDVQALIDRCTQRLADEGIRD
jgi:Arc/MetJ-type ribon-helix-helix transcriptional regulator